MTEYDLRNPNPWPRRIAMGVLYLGALVAFGPMIWRSFYIPYRWTWKPAVHGAQYQIDFNHIDSSWVANRVEFLFDRRGPTTWIFLENNQQGMWLDLATGAAKLAEEQSPIVYRDGVPYDDSMDKMVDGQMIPGRKPKLIINHGERVIDPFDPGVWDLGEGLHVEGEEEEVRFGPQATLVFSGQWHAHTGHGITDFTAADGPFRPYTIHYSTFCGVLTLRIKGQEVYRQRVHDWNSDDFSRTFLYSSGEEFWARSGGNKFGTHLVVVEWAGFRPSKAFVFRINETPSSTATGAVSP